MGHGSKARGVGLLLVGLLVGMLLITPATAHFTTNTRHLGLHAWNQVIKQKVYTRRQTDRRFEMSKDVLWANVSVAGVLGNNKGAVSSQRLGGAGTGDYEVIFNRNVSTCNYQGTLNRTNFTGEMGIEPRLGNAGGIFVVTRNSNGAVGDHPFHVLVICG